MKPVGALSWGNGAGVEARNWHDWPQAAAPTPAPAYTMIKDGAYCDPHHWVMVHPTDPQDCITSVMSTPTCAKKYFFHNSGADNNCGCITDGTDCTLAANQVPYSTSKLYRIEEAVTVCTALNVCGAGEYESTAPTATSDRECKAVTVCTAGEYESTAPTATSDRVCKSHGQCTAYQYESTAPTATSDRECKAVTVCTANQYESAAPTATSDRECK